MSRWLRAFAWLLMLHAVFPMAADASGGMGRYRVRFAEHVIDTGQAASQVLAICRCRQEPHAELGFTGIVVMASPAAANLLSRDPRVAAVEELLDEEDAATMPAAPPVTAAVAPPATVISGPVGPDAHSKFEVLGPYEYDGSGNIRKIGSSVFVYDAYGRVVSGQAAGRTQTYTYDRYGNQVSKTTDGSRSDFPADGATNRMNGATYDGAGRLRSYPGLGTYTFDSLDTLTASTVGAGPAVYVYNASDERIVTYQVDAYGRELSSEWTLRDPSGAVLRRFLKSSDGKWSWDEDYIYLDGKMLAAETAGPHRTLHFHLDHLGTPRLITNHTGAVVSEHAYFPFGEEATSTAQHAEKKKFTGHERDNVGQDYMHARYSTAYWGRFLSVDPGDDADPSSPQTWNKYSYVRNAPVNATDPTGMYTQSITVIAVNPQVLDDFGRWFWGLSAVRKLDRWNTAWSDVAEKNRQANALKLANLVQPTDKQFATYETCRAAYSCLDPEEVLPFMGAVGRRTAFGTAARLIRATRYTPQQQAVVDLAKQAVRRGGVTKEEAMQLISWAKEYGVPYQNHIGTNHWIGGAHIRVGNVNHIKVN